MTWKQLWPVRIVAGGGGAALNFLVNAKPAVLLSALLTAKAPVTPGLSVDAGRASLMLAASATGGASVASSATGTAKATQTPGIAQSATTLSTTTAVQDTPALELVQTKIDLAGTYGATATAVNVSGTNWSNPGNASGTHNGTFASHPGALSAQDAYLDFTLPAFTNKDALTVTSAKLRFYFRQGGTVANNGSIRLYRGTAAAPGTVLLTNITGDIDHTSSFWETDLYAAGLTTFAALSSLGARIRGTLAAGAATVTQDVDAVELVVTATRTDLL